MAETVVDHLEPIDIGHGDSKRLTAGGTIGDGADERTAIRQARQKIGGRGGDGFLPGRFGLLLLLTDDPA